MVDRRVLERLHHRQVGVLKLHVLADERDPDEPSGSARDRSGPSIRAGRAGRSRARAGRTPAGRAPRPADRGDEVDVRGVAAVMTARPPRRRTARSSRAVAIQRGSERHTMTSGGIPMRRSSLTECCVGLVLSSPAASMIRHERAVDVHHVVAADLVAELADRLEEGQALDVADRAADLGDHHVDSPELATRGCAP